MHHSNDRNLCDVSLDSPPRCDKPPNSFSSLRSTLLRLSTSHSLASLPVAPTQILYSSKHSDGSSTSLNCKPSISPVLVNFRKPGGLVSRAQSAATLNSPVKSSPTHFSPLCANPISKRPGDYFSNKLAALNPSSDNVQFSGTRVDSDPHTMPNQEPDHDDSKARTTNINTASAAKNRPKLDGSILSSSDDQSLVVSLPFDHNGSRVTSWTGSLGGDSFVEHPSQKPSSRGGRSSIDSTLSRESADEELDSILESSLNNWSWRSHPDDSESTIIQSRDSSRKVSEPSILLLTSKRPLPRIPLRAASTSAIMQSPSLRRANTLSHRPAPASRKLYGSLTSSNPLGLSRSKSGNYAAKESKERLQFRKKVYDEFCDDDDIMPTDLEHLVFNVPVIKNPHTLYHLNLTSSVNVSKVTNANPKRASEPSISSETILSRRDLMMADGDTKYAGAQLSQQSARPKPFPLPGTIDTNIPRYDSDNRLQQQIPRPVPRQSVGATHEDAEITQNISTFYHQQVQDHFDHTKRERSPNSMNIIPTYVKSQSSLDDVHLISAEKLKFLDQSRPIHLPPKADADKQKHRKEITESMASFQSATQHLTESRRRLAEMQLTQQTLGAKLVQSLMDEQDAQSFNKKFANERHTLRKLVWKSSIPLLMLFSFFLKTLLLNASTSNTLLNIGHSYDLFKENYNHLSPSMKLSKDSEFSQTISRTLERPLIKSLLSASQESNPEFSVAKFESDLRFMMFIKSLSEEGLRKHEETFMLPVLLVMFSSTQLLRDIFCLLELIGQQVLTREVFSSLAARIGSWSESGGNTSLKHFDRTEFEGLNVNAVFDIILQLNDNLPLSLSAACTPVQAHFFIPDGSNTGANTPHDSQRSSMDTMELQKADSSALRLMFRLLLILIVYSNARKTRRKHIVAVFESMMLTVFQFYHINWNLYTELVRQNESIRLNKSSDHLENLMSFTNKWANAFKTI